MVYYTVYQITNNINGKIYVGCHRTRYLDDSYLGSGRLIRKAVEKYGIESFTKEILHVFRSSEAMYAKEAEIVNEAFVRRLDTYNLQTGGRGGARGSRTTQKSDDGSCRVMHPTRMISRLVPRAHLASFMRKGWRAGAC